MEMETENEPVKSKFAGVSVLFIIYIQQIVRINGSTSTTTTSKVYRRGSFTKRRICEYYSIYFMNSKINL